MTTRVTYPVSKLLARQAIAEICTIPSFSRAWWKLGELERDDLLIQLSAALVGDYGPEGYRSPLNATRHAADAGRGGCTFPDCGHAEIPVGDLEGETVSFTPCELEDLSSGRHMAHAGAYDGAQAASPHPCDPSQPCGQKEPSMTTETDKPTERPDPFQTLGSLQLQNDGFLKSVRDIDLDIDLQLVPLAGPVGGDPHAQGFAENPRAHMRLTLGDIDARLIKAARHMFGQLVLNLEGLADKLEPLVELPPDAAAAARLHRESAERRLSTVASPLPE